MGLLRGGWVPLTALAGLTLLAHLGLRQSYSLPGPRLDGLVMTGDALQDVSFTVMGFRRVAADVAWIQLLQYLSAGYDEHHHEEGEAHEEHEAEADPKATAQGLRLEALRVGRLDPHFIEPFYFGAGVLAFDPRLKRPFEAIGLLQEGISRNPREWRLQTIMAAILYKLQDKPGPMIEELEKLAAAPDCPGLMRAILANIYKETGRYRKAMALWELVLESPATSGERDRAKRELAELSGLMSRALSRNIGR